MSELSDFFNDDRQEIFLWPEHWYDFYWKCPPKDANMATLAEIDRMNEWYGRS